MGMCHIMLLCVGAVLDTSRHATGAAVPRVVSVQVKPGIPAHEACRNPLVEWVLGS